MTVQSSLQPTSLEQMLIAAVRQLTPERAVQVLDFARWLSTQNQAELEQEEQDWENTYAANRATFRKLAEQALTELDDGQTVELKTQHGKLTSE